MKKLLIIVLLLVSLNAFSQNYTESKPVEYFSEKVDEFVSLRMIYDPQIKNLTIIYTIQGKSFQEAETFIIVRDRIEKFLKEKGYYHYKEYSEDIIKHKNNSAEYTRFVIFE